MSKFTSFVVFSFGLFLIGAVSVLVVQKHFFPPPLKPVEEQMRLPPTDLPPLEMEVSEEFEKSLDQMFESGGIEAVKQFVQKQFVPGRVVRVDLPQAGPTGEVQLVDREIRPCDLNGAVMLEKPPLLPRLMVAQNMGEGVFLATWSRVDTRKQFVFNAWFYRRKK